MLKKMHIIGAAFFAVLALGVVTAASASAAPAVWLTLSGGSVTTLVPATTDGLLLLHHKFPGILGGGENTVHCDGQFHGTVGPNGEDLVETVTELNGTVPPLDCEVTAESNPNKLCTKGELTLVTPVHLSWKTQLEGELGGAVVDHFFSDGNGEPGYKVRCDTTGREVECTGLDKATFEENKAGEGALFIFHGLFKSSCSDFGEGTVTGHGVVLGFLVS